MKTIASLLLTLTCAMMVTASPVTRQQARQQASLFMQQHGVQIKGEATTTKVRKTQSTNQPLYVFEADDGRGFVVVSGDDSTDAILGYSTTGSYDEATMPPALMEWLDGMAAEIEALNNAAAGARGVKQAGAKTVPTHPAVSPLILTTWNQGNSSLENKYTDGIYNIKCPTMSLNVNVGDETQTWEVYSYTGCVATAGAQIMYYYQHPKAKTKAVPGYTGSSYFNTSANLPAWQFEWDKMKTSYTSGDAWSDAAYAVADLMAYCGYAANMNYGNDATTGGSSASEKTLAEGMAMYFDYDPNTWKSISRSDYSVADWDATIYNELAQGRPVIYSGQSTMGGHAFICDGYDGAGLYHFNWGWGGSGNGYFKLQATNSDGPNGSGYIFDQSSIIGIQPNTGAKASVDFRVSSVAINGDEITLKMWNTYSKQYTFYVGLAEVSDDGTITVLQQMERTLNAHYIVPVSFQNYVTNLSEGTHKLIPVNKISGADWTHCVPANMWFEVTKVGSKVTSVIQHPLASSLSATNFNVTGTKFVGTSLAVDVSISNSGEDHTDPLYLFASTDDSNMGSYRYVAGSAIISGGSEDARFYFQPDVAGTWHLWVATDDAGTNVIGHSTVDIATPPTGEVTLQLVDYSIVCQRDGQATLNMQIKNNSSVTYYRHIESHLWVWQGGNSYGWNSSQDAGTQNLLIVPGQTVTASMTFSGLTDGGKYCLDPRYASTYSYAGYISSNGQAFNSNWWEIEFTYKEPALGDVNGDNAINAADVKATASYLLGQQPMQFAASAADVNGDGVVNIADLTSLINLAQKK